jgi:hypothetical protein
VREVSLKIFIWFFIFILIGCSSKGKNNNLLLHRDTSKMGANVATEYLWQDLQGDATYIRDSVLKKNALITRAQLLTKVGAEKKILEKSIMISKIGSVKNSNGEVQTVMRPEVSQFFVWLDKTKYETEIRLDVKKRGFNVSYKDSTQPEWLKKFIKLPRGVHFCFFSQLPECLKYSGILKEIKKHPEAKKDLFVIWDQYPYQEEIYNQIGEPLYVKAILLSEGLNKAGDLIISLEFRSQILNIQFDSNDQFLRFFWIAQNISVIPPQEKEQLSLEEQP